MLISDNYAIIQHCDFVLQILRKIFLARAPDFLCCFPFLFGAKINPPVQYACFQRVSQSIPITRSNQLTFQ